MNKKQKEVVAHFSPFASGVGLNGTGNRVMGPVMGYAK